MRAIIRRGTAGRFLFIVYAIWSLLLPGGLVAAGQTQVARFPALDFYTGMVEFAGAGDDVLVLPVHGEHPIWQLRYDGWEWTVVATNDFGNWFGELPIYYGASFVQGDDLLVVTEKQDIPVKVHVLRKTDGIFGKAGEIGFDFIALEPGVFDILNTGMVSLENMLIIKLAVGTTGEGEVKRAYPVMKVEGEWVLGPRLPTELVDGWPVLSEFDEVSPGFWIIEAVDSGAGPPYLYSLNEYRLLGQEWQRTQEFLFQHTQLWLPGYPLKGIPSPDLSSIVLYGTEFGYPPPDPYSEIAENKIPLMELRRNDSEWYYFGPVAGGSLDFTNLYIQSIGKTCTLMRRGDVFVYDGTEQRYHLLKYVDGQWALVGDIFPHRPLAYDYFREIFYSMGDSMLTIFDTGLVSPAGRTARGYSVDTLEPVLVKWFGESTTTGPGIEYLPHFGEFEPIFSPGGWGIWLWYPSMGWTYVLERESSGFWFWHAAYGWVYFSSESYDRDNRFYWLYAAGQNEYVWCMPDSIGPHLFYSTGVGEWMSDTVPPPLTQELADQLAQELALELEQEGVQVEIDFPNRIAYFTSQGESNGVPVTVIIHAPFTYQTGTGYPCQARFEMDLENILVTAEGQDPVWVSSTYMWEESQIRLPNHLRIDFIFQTLGTGVIFTTTGFNDGSSEGPVRETW